MVVGAFPIAKLGILAVKQISKPIANVIKSKAKEHPFFRNYVCMPPAQFYNWMEVKTKMWALNLGKPVTVPRLNEAMAIDLGANLLGEFIVFAIGAATLLLEYNRQVNKEAKKEERQKLEKFELANRLTEMAFRIERQDTQIREISRVLSEMESRSIFRWTQERINQYQPFNPEIPNQNTSANPPSTHGVIKNALDYLTIHVFQRKSSSSNNSSETQVSSAPMDALKLLNKPALGTMEDYDNIMLKR